MAASSARVRVAKTACTLAGSCWRRSRSIRRTASSEWPPRAKKLSKRLTRSTASSCCQIAASACSTSPCGASKVLRAKALSSGPGRARRSSLPLAVSGSSGMAIYAAGII
ncbi:hypothetical protein EJP617_D060 (plasmid) [Erwinia sp. Ejp617]|nr:hypothetical protein EJP617_D060 [Erwinia sp. Ejp617]